MCANSSEHRRPARGFTMVELIAVLLLVGVLAVTAIPRLNTTDSLRGAAWRDQVQAAVLQARSLAAGHRRLVCLAVATGEVRLRMASANPAATCDTAVPGPDGNARWASDPQNLAVSASPGATLHFQPDGRVTQPGGTGTAANFTISIAGQAGLTVFGATGHVQ
jgi:MSHA pilin protein MshC